MTHFQFSIFFLIWASLVGGMAAWVWRRFIPALGDLADASLVGSFAIAVVLFPYWMLGQYSAIGWYDEYDAIIPYSILAALNPLSKFDHTIAGGAQIETLQFATNHMFSLFEMLIRAIGPQWAALLYRFLGHLVLYLGAYQTMRHLFGTRQLPAIVGALIVVFGTVYPYGWVLGGYGWTIGVVTWCGILVFGRMSVAQRLLAALVLGILTVSASHPFTFVAWVAFYLPLLWILLPERLISLLQRSALPGFLVAAIAVLGSWRTFSTFAVTQGESARYRGIDSLASFEASFGASVGPQSETLWEAIRLSTLYFYNFALSGLGLFRLLSGGSLNGYPLTFVFFIGGMFGAVWLGVYERQWRYLVGLLAILGLVYVLSVMALLVEVPLLSNFSWYTVYNVIWPVIGVIWALLAQAILDRRKRILTTVSSTALALCALVSCASMAQISLGTVHAYGGWAVMNNYPLLRDIAVSEPLTRVASTPTGWPNAIIAPFNGLAAIDGQRPSYTWRRSAYWYLTLNRTPATSWNPNYQTLGTNLADINEDALRMSNVGYLLSTSADLPGHRQVAAQPSRPLLESGLPGAEVLGRLLPGFEVLPPIYVYAVDKAWDRVFVPTAIEMSPARDTQVEYYAALRDLPHHSILVPENGPDWLGAVVGKNSLAVIEAEANDQGLDVVTNGSPGLLIYNQEYSARWTASCEDQSLPIAPVNGMMMATEIPSGCTTVFFRFAEAAVR